MNQSPLLLPIIMAVAEVIGAVLFVSTRDSGRRAALACFGLGFALCIVAADIIPDAVEDNAQIWFLVAIGAAVGTLLMFKGGQSGASIGSAAGIAGMGLHNICEGIVLAAAGPALSPLIFAGAIAHKLPEGMVVFQLADRLSVARRWVVAGLLSLLIPIGTTVVLPEAVRNPVLGFAAGVLLAVLVKSLLLFVGRERSGSITLSRGTIAAATAGGAILAGATCLVI